ncbi:MAG: hypothetical protein ACE5H1_01645, partial [Thermodesulfobacteriota bacterium]
MPLTQYPDTTVTAKPISTRVLKTSWIKNYLEYSEGQESPKVFHLWSALTMLSAAVRRNIYFDQSYFKVFPNLFVMFVSPPGRSRKGGAIDVALPIITKIDGLKILHEKLTPEGLIKYLLHDSIKADGKKIHTECNTFIICKELSVLFSKSSYTAGLVELLTSLYDCPDEWDYTTSSKGKVKFQNVHITMWMASNPEWLAKSLPEDAFG